MKTNRLITAALLLLFISCGTDRSANNNTDAFTDADAVYISLNKEYTLNLDGTVDIHYSHRLKYLTYFSSNRLYGETFIVYNPMYFQLRIDKSETTMADGKKVTAPENSFNEVLPHFAANAPAYNHLREMVVTHTGLENGALANLEYTLHSSEEYLPFLSGHEFLEASSPVKKFSLSVRIPAGTELKFHTLNDSLTPEIVCDEEWTTYKWAKDNIPACPKFDRCPGNTPQLFFSTAAGLDEAKDYLTSLPAFDLEVSTEMKDKALKETEKEKDPLQKALKLQKIIVNNLNHYRVTPEEAAFRCRTPREVWEDNGGTALEKTILFTALLKSVDIEARPVFSATKGTVKKEVGSLQYFHNFYIQITPCDESAAIPYLSAVEMNEPYNPGFSGNEIVPLEKDIPSRLTGAIISRITAEGVLTLRKDNSLTGEIQAGFTMFSSRFGQLSESVSNAKKLFQDASDAVIRSLEPGESRIEFTINKNEACREQAEYLFLTLPQATGSYADAVGILPAQRDVSFDLETAFEESYKVDVVLPGDIVLSSAPERKIMKNACGNAEVAIAEKENGFSVTRKIEINKDPIPPELYGDFRKLVLLWQEKKFREIVLHSNNKLY
ncbi:MAG: DUF3857 domain-containing protein [Bacteroidetes bacterium]|nr:DUF3857 domain-containing protein [Bacteroidota bacterium]